MVESGALGECRGGEALHELRQLVAGKEGDVPQQPFGEWHSCANAWHSVVFPCRRAGRKSCAIGGLRPRGGPRLPIGGKLKHAAMVRPPGHEHNNRVNKPCGEIRRGGLRLRHLNDDGVPDLAGGGDLRQPGVQPGSCGAKNLPCAAIHFSK